MELINLYPRWLQHVSADSFISCLNSYPLLQTLKLSLLHHSYLIDLFGIDKLSYKTEVNWVLWSYELELVYKLRHFTDLVSSCVWLWPSANWLERETWEMFGVIFTGHPDLRRLLTDYGFRGYPLLKSYPLTGYFQLFYSEKNKRITATPVFLAQEFREFDFKSPWLE